VFIVSEATAAGMNAGDGASGKSRTTSGGDLIS
jgi:hypothetical protein